MRKIAVMVGSLSAKSINRTLAQALEKLASDKLSFDYLDLASLPMFNADLLADLPASVSEMKKRVAEADAVLIVMPEYNRSFPPVIKNALDWGSRPWGQTSWTGKPLALASATPGAGGGMAAQNHLRAILPVLGFVVIGQPEVYFQFKPELFDENLDITNESTRAFLGGFVDAFARFIDQHAPQTVAIAAE
jgi:chromate reductase